MPKTPSRNATQQPARTNSPREVRSFGSSKRPHPHAKQLVAVPVEAVAGIAATLSREGVAPRDAVAQAYELLDLAEGPALRSEVVKHLMARTGCGERACQKAIEPKGRYGDRLVFDEWAVGLRE